METDLARAGLVKQPPQCIPSICGSSFGTNFPGWLCGGGVTNKKCEEIVCLFWEVTLYNVTELNLITDANPMWREWSDDVIRSFKKY